MKHDYNSALNEANVPYKRFIIKIYGKSYFGFKYDPLTPFIDKEGQTYNAYDPLTSSKNLICRVFENDLPVASHINNFSSFCVYATRLVGVKIPRYHNIFLNATNMSSLFAHCPNLNFVLGIEDHRPNNVIVNNMFVQDYCLQDTDFIIPAAITSLANIFGGCGQLSTSFSKLLPKCNFMSHTIDMNNAFGYARKIKDANILEWYFWNNKNVQWQNYSKTFFDPEQKNEALNIVMEHVPISWGGTASDNVI
jgi:hypothetical protein